MHIYLNLASWNAKAAENQTKSNDIQFQNNRPAALQRIPNKWKENNFVHEHDFLFRFNGIPLRTNITVMNFFERCKHTHRSLNGPGAGEWIIWAQVTGPKLIRSEHENSSHWGKVHHTHTHTWAELETDYQCNRVVELHQPAAAGSIWQSLTRITFSLCYAFLYTSTVEIWLN